MRHLNSKAVVSIAVGISIIIGIVASVGFIGDSQNPVQNEIILEESIEIVEKDSKDNTTEEAPTGKQFTIELEESVSIKGE